MNRTITVTVTASIIALALIAVVVTGIFDHGDVGDVIAFVTVTVVPSTVSLFAYNEASQAKTNTNGLLHATMQRALDAENKLAAIAAPVVKDVETTVKDATTAADSVKDAAS